MSESFLKGVQEGTNTMGSTLGGYVGGNRISELLEKQSVCDEIINSLKETVNTYQGTRKSIDYLKGDVFEHLISETFNLDAAKQGAFVRALVPKSNTFASPDIALSTGKTFGLKNYKSGTASAKAQAVSVNEYYWSKNKNSDLLFDDFLKQKNILTEDINKSMYQGQARIIPSDQLMVAKEYLKQKISIEQIKRPEQAGRYQETLARITDRIEHEGIMSRKFTQQETKEIARMAKEGSFDPEKYGITSKDLNTFGQILNQSLSAGATAALIALILKITPQMILILKQVAKGENISLEQLREFGLDCLSASGQAFICGSMCSVVVGFGIKIGLFAANSALAPSIIATTIYFLFNTTHNALKMAAGTIGQEEFGYYCMRDITTSLSALGTGILLSFLPLSPVLSIVGILMGNLMGAIIGGLIFDQANNLFLSFCADTGFNFFGFVKQDYSLPDDVLRDMGLDIIVTDTCVPDSCVPDSCVPDSCILDSSEPDLITKYILKRGVIGINRVGYLLV